MEASGIPCTGETDGNESVGWPPQAQKGPGYAVKQVVGVLTLVGLGLRRQLAPFRWPCIFTGRCRLPRFLDVWRARRFAFGARFAWGEAPGAMR